MLVSYSTHNYCINCDWLQFSVLLDEFLSPTICCPDGCNVEILPGNNIFKDRLICTRVTDGAKLFTMLWHPYSSLIAANLATVQFGNYVLYADGVHAVFRLVQECVSCQFNSLGRVDVCCDFQVDRYELMRIRQLYNGDAYVSRKREGSLFWHRKSDDADALPHCLSWGSKHSEIKVKLYNKSREIGVVNDVKDCTKPYIMEQWQQAGFDVQKVWRLEFSMCSSGMLRYKGEVLTLDHVASSEWLHHVFVELYQTRFVTRLRGAGVNGHHNDDTVFYLLYLSGDYHLLKWAEGTHDTPATTESITLLRKIMLLLESPLCCVSSDVFESMSATVFKLCEQRSVLAYFKHCYGDEPVNVLQAMYDQTGEGVREGVPKLSQSYM